MRGPGRTAVLAALSAISGCATTRAGSPFVTDACPIVSAGPRYAVVARALGGQAVDTAYLLAVARSVVNRWDPNATRRRLDPQSEDAARTASAAIVRYPVIPFWDWRPGPEDSAEVALTIRRGGQIAARLMRASGDRAFDRSLLDAVAAATSARDVGRVMADTLPRDLPPGIAGDSLVVTLRFGSSDGASMRDGTALYFARQSRPALGVKGNPPPRYPDHLREWGLEAEVLIAFQVTPEGYVREGSLSVVTATDPRFVKAVLEVAPHYRFEPALLDCQVVPMWVHLPFAFVLRHDDPDRLTGPPSLRP